MTIRLFSARQTAADLAAGRIAASDQSLYLTASFLIWIIPGYLFVFPAPRTSDPEFFWGILLTELALLVLFCIAGIRFCLRNCRVDPARHFLVDFSCLNAPISLTTLLIVWAAFYLTVWLLSLTNESWLASTRVYDVVRMIASAGAVLIVFLRIGRHMNRISLLRESARSVPR